MHIKGGETSRPFLIYRMFTLSGYIMATIYIPSLMRDLTCGLEIIQVEGTTMRQIITSLEEAHPGFRKRLIDEDSNRIKPNIAVMIDGRNANRSLLDKVKEASEIHFLPAISGG